MSIESNIVEYSTTDTLLMIIGILLSLLVFINLLRYCNEICGQNKQEVRVIYQSNAASKETQIHNGESHKSN